MACYTVGVAGLPVEQMSSDSGGATPSHATNFYTGGAMVAEESPKLLDGIRFLTSVPI